MISIESRLDLDSSRKILHEFEGTPACVIVKHNNPCGVALGGTALAAYEKALACDPVSAFGGVIVFNDPIDRVLAERMLPAMSNEPYANGNAVASPTISSQFEGASF